MKNDSFFVKVQTALTKRGEQPRLSTEEQLRLAHLLASGFLPIAAANVLIATRGMRLSKNSAAWTRCNATLTLARQNLG